MRIRYIHADKRADRPAILELAADTDAEREQLENLILAGHTVGHGRLLGYEIDYVRVQIAEKTE